MDTGLFGFPVCLLWGDVTDSGVDRPTIVIGFDGREQVAPRGIAVGVFALMDEFGFQGAEDALIGALSRQFGLRLIDGVMAAACRILR